MTDTSASTRPNILFIMADDLGYADVSCYGQRDYTTPNIDRLALEGLRFTQGYANSSVCSATRVALMTGRYQYRIPVGLEEPLSSQNRTMGLPPDHPTLVSLLKQAGYATALVGKWHLGHLPNYGPLKSGYEEFYGIMGGGADYFRHGPDSAAPLFEAEVPVEQHGYMTNLLGGRAVEVIGRYAQSRRPFFLSLHFTAPHWPWEGPDDLEVSKGVTNLHHYDGGTQRTYMRMVQSLDHNIGRALQALDLHGLSRNTIVIFTSDNGGERFSKTWPFTGMKTELLAGGLRVPMIIRWPARVAAGMVSDQTMITMDWTPTLLAAAGVAHDPAYPSDGDDLTPTLTGGPVYSRKFFWRYKAASQRAVRDGDWKYLRLAGNEFLFDVAKDPRERANLKGKHPEVFERLRRDWEDWNATMLPERTSPAQHTHIGSLIADHYGVTNGD